MNRLDGVLVGFLLALCITPGAWLAQTETDPEASSDQVESSSEFGEGGDLASGATSPLDEIDQILEGDDEVLAGGGYTYERDDRRDPFLSPLRRQDLDLPRGPRPEGKAGLLIDEISLTGLFGTAEGMMAQVRGGAKDKSYLLIAGDQLYDGEVVAVRAGEVEFKKVINDPAAIKPFREVVKRLDPKK
ncbi:MAG: hypothetical protein K0U98_16665 [Deltaproteobacteria bacterium]|nr:hypothetical protein [Deltaproteobacteria bacterium]